MEPTALGARTVPEIGTARRRKTEEQRFSPDAPRESPLLVPQLTPEGTARLQEYSHKVSSDLEHLKSAVPSEVPLRSTETDALSKRFRLPGRTEATEPEHGPGQPSSKPEESGSEETLVTREQAMEHLKKALLGGGAVSVRLDWPNEFDPTGKRDFQLTSLDPEAVLEPEETEDAPPPTEATHPTTHDPDSSPGDPSRPENSPSNPRAHAGRPGSRITMSLREFLAKLESYVLPAK